MPTAEPSPSRLLLVLFLGVLMAALDIALVATTLTAIRSYFGVDERGISWVLGLFVLFTLVGLPLMARLSDVYGRRTVYLADVGLFAVGALVVVSAPTFSGLLAGRCLQGLGASGIFPVASAVIGDRFPPERRGRMLGALGAVYGLAFIIGPIIGGILVPYGWQGPFLVNLGLAVVVAGLAWWLLPNTRDPQPRALDWKGVLTLSALLAAVSFGINRIDTADVLGSLGSLNVWPFLVVVVILLPLFVRIERRAPEPLLRLTLLGRQQVILASSFAAGAGLAEAAFVFFADFATASFDVTAREASFMLLPLVTAVAIGSPVAGRMLDRIGSRAIIFSGTSLLTLGLAALALLPPTRAVFYTGSVLIGAGLAGLLGSALSYILLNEAQADERAVAQGIITIFISIGQLVGAALIGAVAASGASAVVGYKQAFLVIAGVDLVLVVASTALKSRSAELASVAR